MTDSQYVILKYLDEAQGPVSLDKFPSEVRGNFIYGIKPGSLIHELEITLKNAGWINTPGYAHGPFSITNQGKQALYPRLLSEENRKLTMNIKVNKQFEDLLFYLAKEEKRNSYSDFDEVCQELNIEEESRTWILSHLYRSNYVTGPTSSRTKEMRITTKGLERIDEIEDEYFNKYGKTMNQKIISSTSLEENCERLFKMHKERGYTIEWSKETFYNQRGDLDNPKQKMLEEGILITGRDWQETKLRSEFWAMDSYQEAVTAAKHKNESLRSITNTTNIHGDHNNVASGATVHQNISISILKKEDEENLKSYGVNQEEIEELRNIVTTKPDDKENLTSKLMKWLTSVSSALAARGIYEHIPNVIALVQTLGNQHS